MDRLPLDALSAPGEVVQSLRTLSAHIVFSKTCKKGGNGYLFFGKNTVLNRRVAVKYYYWGGDKTYHAEPKHLAEIDSPNVVQILDAALLDNDYAYFMTPYYKNGDLDDLLSTGIRGNRSAVNLASEILNGLTHLHSRCFLHRDLKPQNIFLSDSGSALIGDFGSVKQVPEGHTSVPGSGHSLLYRPPESIDTGVYSYVGDIYQVGIILYQLLGGYLPYEEAAWLNMRQLSKYRAIADPIDRTLYADEVIKARICRGSLIQISSLPPWVCHPLRRVISKACNKIPEKRFESPSAFLAKLHQLLPVIKDWKVINGLPTVIGSVSYRVRHDPISSLRYVEKKKKSNWRRDNSFAPGTINELISAIEPSTGH